MLFKWRIKKIYYNGRIYYMPQRKGWIFWNSAKWDEYSRVYNEESYDYFSLSNKLELPNFTGFIDYVAFANIEDAKRLIKGIEKNVANKKKHKKELDKYIYIDDDSISKELKK